MTRILGTVGQVIDRDFHPLKGLIQDACMINGLSCWDALIRWRVTQNPRPRRRAGLCKIYQREIELHSTLFKAERRQELEETLLHELAHVIDHLVFKGRGHGRTWKEVMRALELEPTRCHSLDFLQEDHQVQAVACRRRSEVDYLCEKCKFVWTRSRSLPRRRIYSHRNCGGIFSKI